MAGTSLSSPSDSVQGLFIDLADETGLALFAHCFGSPSTAAKTFQHGCILTQIDTADGDFTVFENTGTPASPDWMLIGSGGGGGTPGGSNKQLQYNASGSFGGLPFTVEPTDFPNIDLTVAVAADGLPGGNFSVTAGVTGSGTSEDAGSIILTGGAGLASGGDGGDIILVGGASAIDHGGDVNITPGLGNAGKGSIILDSHQVANGGTGDISIVDGTETLSNKTILDSDHLLFGNEEQYIAGENNAHSLSVVSNHSGDSSLLLSGGGVSLMFNTSNGLNVPNFQALNWQKTDSTKVQALMVDNANVLQIGDATIANQIQGISLTLAAAMDFILTGGFGSVTLDRDSVAAARTVIFPDKDGTFAYTSDIPTVTIEAAETNSGITPFADGTYTVGLGTSQNGTITIVKGIITGVQEAML